MNPKLRNIFKRIREFVRCFKNTTIEIDSVLKDINRIHLEDQPSDKRDGG